VGANAPGMFVDGSDAFRIFAFITNEDHTGLMQHLRFLKAPIDIMNMQDSRNFTVLTYAAYRNLTNVFKVLFEYAWKHTFTTEQRTEGQIAKF